MFFRGGIGRRGEWDDAFNERLADGASCKVANPCRKNMYRSETATERIIDWDVAWIRLAYHLKSGSRSFVDIPTPAALVLNDKAHHLKNIKNYYIIYL